MSGRSIRNARSSVERGSSVVMYIFVNGASVYSRRVGRVVYVLVLVLVLV